MQRPKPTEVWNGSPEPSAAPDGSGEPSYAKRVIGVKRASLILLLTVGLTPVARAQSGDGPVDADRGQELLLPVPACTACARVDATKTQPVAQRTVARILTAPLRLVRGNPSDEANLEPIGVPAQMTISPVEAAAAKIKGDEAGAKSRRAAVHYLGTVDCHYYPEAEAALIGALRADRNEAVRLEAVLALGSGYCRTKRTMDALNLVVSGSEQDGNPAETSARVRQAAALALQQYMARGGEAIARPAPRTLPRVPEGQSPPPNLQLASYVAVAQSISSAPSQPTTTGKTIGNAPKTATSTGSHTTFHDWFSALISHETPASAYRHPGLTPIGVVPGE